MVQGRDWRNGFDAGSHIFPQPRAGLCVSDLAAVRTQIRERRKRFLGSNISLLDIVAPKYVINDKTIEKLSKYLAVRAGHFWKPNNVEAEKFCEQFFLLAIYAIAGGEVGNESVDDIIQLAECLVRDIDVFTTVMKNLLPTDMIGMLFEFTEICDGEALTVHFEDAVLGAVSVFLGVLEDPIPQAQNKSLERSDPF